MENWSSRRQKTFEATEESTQPDSNTVNINDCKLNNDILRQFDEKTATTNDGASLNFSRSQNEILPCFRKRISL